MRLFTAAIVSAGALMLVSCGHKTEVAGQNTTTVTTDNDTAFTPPSAPVSADQAFANAAAASDAFEIATSQLALGKAHSPTVKAFAKQMIAAHTESTAKLKAAVSNVSPAISPDPTLTSEQQTTLNTLGGLSGADFDKAYVAAQADGHTKTLEALKNYAATGEVAELKDFATKLVPIVTAHLDMARDLKP